MAENKEPVGKRIRRVRESLGISQEELEERARLRPGTVSRIEAGTPPGLYLNVIADVLGVTPDDLRFGLDPVVQVAIARIPSPKIRQEFVELAKVQVSRRPRSRNPQEREVSEKDLEVMANDFLARKQLEDEIDIFGLVD